MKEILKTAALIFAATMANAQKVNEPPKTRETRIVELVISDRNNTHRFFITEKDERTGVVLRFVPYEISSFTIKAMTCLPPCLPCPNFKPTIIDYKYNAKKA